MNITQNKTLKCLFKCFEHNDVVIVSGKKLGIDSFKYNNAGTFYINELPGFALPFSLGIAMCTDKRVFTIMTDSDFIYSTSSSIQAGVSKCKNIFFIILCTGRYNEYDNQPNIFNNIKAIKGVLFNTGLLVQDYTSYIKGTNSLEALKNLISNARGPLVSLIRVDKWINSKVPADTVYPTIDKLHNFINNTEIGTSMFTVPVTVRG